MVGCARSPAERAVAAVAIVGGGRVSYPESLPITERREELLLLCFVRHVGQHVNVALVRRRNVERRRPEEGVAGFLEDRRAITHVESVSAVLDRRMRGEDTGFFCCRLHLDADCIATRYSDVTGVFVFDGEHYVAREVARLLAQRHHLRRGSS